ncbi:MAG: N-acetyltransferase [Chloroflexi bacterium]|nr:N-acetyltransferase [Chloroflexota bacterium]
MNTKNVISAPPGKINFRTAELVDLPAIVEIYNQAVPTHRSTANTTPVTVEGRKAWFYEHDPDQHPIFVAEVDGQVVGWCSLSVYRPGRSALRFTAEISCYIDNNRQRQGVGRELVRHALEAAPSLGIKNIVAVLIDRNEASRKMVEKLGFQQWGYLPRVLDFDGQECGEFYYGIRVAD